tara:strand:+ start:2838 stop:3758 length:921 start_codon:yes stop_codon:yes gene_type:complete
MNKVWGQLDIIQNEVLHPNSAQLYLRVINLTAFLLITWMLPIADQVWGMDYFVIIDHEFSGLKRAAVLLREPFFREYYEFFVYPFLMLTALAVFGVSNFWSRLVTWVLFVNLHYADYEVSNGGWHVLHHLLLLSIFLFKLPRFVINGNGAFHTTMHNLGFLFSWIQVCILYLTAGSHKFLGSYWVYGDALFVTLSIQEFSLPWIMDFLDKNTWYLKVGNWISLFYQVSFPVLIWFKSVRPFLLPIGLVFHLSIAFLVGVLDFGLILVAAYAMFIPDETAKKLLYWLTINRFRKPMAGNNIIKGIGD